VLSARLGRLERLFPAPDKSGRAICIVAGDGDEAGVQQLLEAEGYDPTTAIRLSSRGSSPPLDRSHGQGRPMSCASASVPEQRSG
jgi:hypothetical protein